MDLITKNSRLLIIGNGLDLAHGLKTGYGDFLNYTHQVPIGLKNSLIKTIMNT